MELEESFQGPVDPEIRAYVYSLVSAVCPPRPDPISVANDA